MRDDARRTRSSFFVAHTCCQPFCYSTAARAPAIGGGVTGGTNEHVSAESRAGEGGAHGNWLLGLAVRSTVAAFRQAWSATPAAAKRRWMTTLAVGFAICAALMAAITLAARANESPLRRWDERVIRLVERGPVSFSNAILLESFGNLTYLVPVTLAAAFVAARAGRPLVALTFPLAYALQRPLVLIGWWLWNRRRPEIIAAGIAAPPLHSFPSGHVALMLSVYGLLAWLWVRASRSAAERTLAVLLLAVLLLTVGWARVRLGAHWPSDVLAGYVIGSAWLITVVRSLRKNPTLAAL
jgi:undecaprenyl-diphosphatase